MNRVDSLTFDSFASTLDPNGKIVRNRKLDAKKRKKEKKKILQKLRNEAELQGINIDNDNNVTKKQKINKTNTNNTTVQNDDYNFSTDFF